MYLKYSKIKKKTTSIAIHIKGTLIYLNKNLNFLIQFFQQNFIEYLL